LLQQVEKAGIVFAGSRAERFVGAERIFRTVITGTVGSGTFDVARLKRYFESRTLFEQRQYSAFDQLRLDQLREDRRVFSGEKVEGLYERWKDAGDEVLVTVPQSGLAFRTVLLPDSYEWISPIYGGERRVRDALDSIANKARS